MNVPPPPPSDDRTSRGNQLAADLISTLGAGFPGHTMRRMRSPDGRYSYSYVSPGVRESFDLDPDRLTASDGVTHDWIHPDDRAPFLNALEESAATLTPFDEEVRVRLSDGRFKWIRSMGQPRRLNDGTVIWDGVALDVTERHDALSSIQSVLTAARRDEASKSRLASIAARDLAEPLGILKQRTLDLADVCPDSVNDRVDGVIDAVRHLELAIDAAFGLLGAGLSETPPAPAPEATTVKAEAGPIAPLTKRQQEVLALVQEGLSNQEIANRLDIKVGTVKLHVSAILQQLGARNRTEAARFGNGAQS